MSITIVQLLIAAISELFVLLTPKGAKVVGAGAADDAISEAFAKRRTS